MTQDAAVDEDGVRALARAANLPLTDDRIPAIAGVLQEWLPAAIELSRIMSAPEHQASMPVTVFAHAPADLSE